MEIEKIIKENQKVFFDNKGITSTSANHVCNKGKELLKAKQEFLNNIKFFNTTACLLSNNTTHVISSGMKSDEFKDMEDCLTKIYELNAMTSWLREAIKAKNEIISKISHMTDGECTKIIGIEMPECESRIPYITEDEIIGSWDVNKRKRYYKLQAYCSLIGKFIHPKGSFYEAKKKINEIIQNPNVIDGNGRDAIIYTYSPSMTSDEVVSEYNKLATELRHKEAEFNKMQAEIDDAIANDKIEKDTEYEKIYESYRKDINKFRIQIKSWKNKANLEATKLKIHLPDDIKMIYEKITNGDF